MKNNTEEPSSSALKRKWRDWHEREIPVHINGKTTKNGVLIEINSEQLQTNLELKYPNNIWQRYPKDNKVKLLDNLTYIFTAHFPFLLKGNIRLEYNTGYPQAYSWANQCFMRFLPAYWYLYRGRRGTKVFPLLKTLLNSRALFAETKDFPPLFPNTIDENVIIPFTFGKDSFLTYSIASDIGLSPTLVYFNEPTERYARKHKLALIKSFEKKIKEKVYYLENPLGMLREYGEGWFGWELAMTSWALLALPFAYFKKAGYLLFANEASCNDFIYDSENLKVVPDYEQSGQATEELSMLTQALSEGEVYTTTFLQGLHEIAALAILKYRYRQYFRYLMSCWAETKAAKNKRWCADCSKCARIFLYLCANGIDPIKEAGFENNLLLADYERLYNVFGKLASGTGFDAFGTNRDEQLLAFYLTWSRGNKSPLVKKFRSTEAFDEAEKRFSELMCKYFYLHEEFIAPPQWKKKIDRLLSETLQRARNDFQKLKPFKEFNLIPYQQKTDWTCGPACLKVAFAYLGIKKKVRELIKELGATPQNGTDHRDMVRTVKTYHFNFFTKENSRLEDIRTYLKDYLIIVDYWIPYYQDSHYSIVKKLGKNRIYFHDTHFGPNHSYKIAYFLNNWRDQEARGWLLAIKK